MVKDVLKTDITIVGAGIVGLSIANLLKDLPLSIALVEAHDIPEWSDEEYGMRVSAISKASETTLDSIGAWEGFREKRMSPYTDMYVWETAFDGQDAIHFSAAQSALPNLGHIVENDLMRSELKTVLSGSHKANIPKVSIHKAFIHWCMPDKLETIEQTEKSCRITLKSGQLLETKLLIGADGASSVTRRKLGLASLSRSYEQMGLVAQLKLNKPHQKTAYQRFVENDILAFLPLTTEDQVSMVWSVSESKAQRVQSQNTESIETELTDLMQKQFGRVKLLTEIKSFPLQVLHSRHYVSNRVVLCGDAAHAIHPLAGQGVNLGLLDAKTLSDVLHQAWNDNYDLGDLSILRAYERERKAGNVRMMTALDGLFNLFQSQQSGLQSVRRFGMGVVNRVAPIKNELMQHALGLK